MNVVSFIALNGFLFFLSFFIFRSLPWGNKCENKSFVWKGDYIFIILFFFIVGAVRPVVYGTDNATYVDLYQYVGVFGELPLYLQNTEIGYSALNMLFSATLGFPYYIFFGILTALTWGIYLASSYRYQFLLPWMLFFTICSGFLFWSFNGIRQSLSIVIFLFSIKYIIERNFLFYAFTLALASLFHISVIFLLPLYFLVGIRFKRNFWLIAYISSILFMENSFLNEAADKLFTLFFQFVPYFDNYEKYTTSDSFFVSRQETATDTGLGIILKIFVTLFILFFSNRTLIRFPGLRFYLLLFSLGAIFSNLFFSIEMIGRLLNYFSPLFGLLMAATLYSFNRKYTKIVFLIFFIVYILLFIKQTFTHFG